MSGQSLTAKIKSEVNRRLRKTDRLKDKVLLLRKLGRNEEAEVIEEGLEDKRLARQKDRNRTLAIAVGDIK